MQSMGSEGRRDGLELEEGQHLRHASWDGSYLDCTDNST